MSDLHELLSSPDWVDWSDPVNWDHDLNDDLISWWLAAPDGCGFGSFTWRDLCRRNNGTLTNMDPATDWVGSHHGAGLQTDGSNDTIACGSDSSLDDLSAFTYECFFRYDSEPAGVPRALISKANNFEATKVLSVGGNFPDGQVSGDIATDSTSAISNIGGVLTIGVVYHVVMTYDNAGDRTVRLYLNGTEGSYSTQTAATGTATSDASAPFRISGRGNTTVSVPAAATYFSVKVYSRVLSASEILFANAASRRGYPGLLNRVPLRRMSPVVAAGGGFQPAWGAFATHVLGGSFGA